MSDLQTIPGNHNTYTYGVDDYGEFGSLATAESDHEVPEPLELLPHENLATLLSFSDKLAEKKEETEIRLYDGILSRIKHLDY